MKEEIQPKPPVIEQPTKPVRLWRPFERSYFSQFGEDGVIQCLFGKIDRCTEKVPCRGHPCRMAAAYPKGQRFIEIGVDNGYQCNTRYLWEQGGWTGVGFNWPVPWEWAIRKRSTEGFLRAKAEGMSVEQALKAAPPTSGPWMMYPLVEADVRPDNVNKLIEQNGGFGCRLLSIDIDGNDYWVLAALDWKKLRPDILVVEYRATLGWKDVKTVPYTPDFRWSGKDDWCGASLAAFVRLLGKKGYTLVYCGEAGLNAFFVRTDLVHWTVDTIENIYRPATHHRGHGYAHSPKWDEVPELED